MKHRPHRLFFMVKCRVVKAAEEKVKFYKNPCQGKNRPGWIIFS